MDVDPSRGLFIKILMIHKSLGLLLAPVLGLSAVILPVFIWPVSRHYDAPLFPILRDAVEGVGIPQFALLFIAGTILGAISDRQPWLLAAVTVILLPIASIAEMFVDPTSHNLFPVEFAFYALFSLVVGSGISTIRRVLRGSTASAKPLVAVYSGTSEPSRTPVK